MIWIVSSIQWAWYDVSFNCPIGTRFHITWFERLIVELRNFSWFSIPKLMINLANSICMYCMFVLNGCIGWNHTHRLLYVHPHGWRIIWCDVEIVYMDVVHQVGSFHFHPLTDLVHKKMKWLLVCERNLVRNYNDFWFSRKKFSLWWRWMTII